MTTPKTQADILKKLNITELNEMQQQAMSVINSTENTVLLSPTGTGKTLAFLLPVLNSMELDINKDKGVQALIVVPTRELAIQIEQVVRDMGTGLKVNAVYGGRGSAIEKEELKHAPSILIGTPGRVADHIDRNNFDTTCVKTLILDEFDKSLEIGFERDMISITSELTSLNKRILTSATNSTIPDFVGLQDPQLVNFLPAQGENSEAEDNSSPRLTVKKVISPSKDKTETLMKLLQHIGNEQAIVFCNFKDSIRAVSQVLEQHNISFSCFSGGMEQRDRERSLIKFRNGTSNILLATDLAARGIDIPAMKYLIHFELPPKVEEFTHRNGRTARVDKSGTAFAIHSSSERLRDFMQDIPTLELFTQKTLKPSSWETLYISGGRKDKISKGDVAGLFFKQGNLEKHQLGAIELKQDCAFVAVPVSEAKRLIELLNNKRLKNKKVRITVA